MSTVRRHLPTVLISAGLVAWAWFNLVPHPEKLEGPLPEFSAATLAGARLTKADLKGKVAILNFWSPG